MAVFMALAGIFRHKKALQASLQGFLLFSVA